MTHPAITAYLNHLTHIGRAPATIATYRSALTTAERELPEGLLAYPEEIETWLGTYPAAGTRALKLSVLRSAYAWWIKRGLYEGKDPTTELDPVRKPRRTPRPCTDGELALIIAKTGEPVWLWAVIAALSGARCVEIAHLDREHITRETVWLHGKGGHERHVPTHPELWAVVEALPAGPVAGGRSRNSISATAAREFDAIGLPDVTMHRLRHWCLTQVQRATGDIRITQEIGGHASVSTTQGYAAVAGDALRQAVLALPSITGTGAPTSAGWSSAEDRPPR